MKKIAVRTVMEMRIAHGGKVNSRVVDRIGSIKLTVTMQVSTKILLIRCHRGIIPPTPRLFFNIVALHTCGVLFTVGADGQIV
ncbi:hypothetical protein PMSD_00350 [Paenibacillus macquariensis subsp. defensor]|nr:hypothetical protein PMSD_00350 [Paenibacillus macquariensis subsp. defensor]